MKLKDYEEFVSTVTSTESQNLSHLTRRMSLLDTDDVNIALLLTGAMGISSEGGEFAADTQYHLKRELGDIMWYWINSCRALGLDPNEVIKENVFKLESRYPGGKFDTYFSENRKEGDL